MAPTAAEKVAEQVEALASVVEAVCSALGPLGVPDGDWRAYMRRLEQKCRDIKQEVRP